MNRLHTKTLQLLIVLCFTISMNGFAGTLVAGSDNDNFFTIDTDTLVVTTVGGLGTDLSFGGMAWDPNSETLYMIGGRANENLYTVDRSTGAATLIGAHDVNDLFGLAYDSTNDVLYGSEFLNTGGLYTINTSTGEATEVATIDLRIGALAYNSLTDQLVGLRAGPEEIYEIDRTDGTQTLLFTGPGVDNSGFAFDPDKNLYWAAERQGELISYDPDDSFNRTVVLTGLDTNTALAYLSAPQAPTQPVPATSLYALLLLLTTVGGVGLIALRRS